jgi:hypothetical protein
MVWNYNLQCLDRKDVQLMAGIQLSDNNHTFEPVIADKLQNAGNNIKVVIVPQYSRAPPC